MVKFLGKCILELKAREPKCKADEVKLVIFDLDGTLVNVPCEWSSVDDEIERKLKMNIHPYSMVIPNLTRGVKTEIFKIFEKYELKSLPYIVPNHKTLNYLHSCRDKGMLTALVTLQGKKFVKRFNLQFDLDFDEIVTREDSFSRTEQLRMVLSRMNVSPEHTIFVGNTEQDRESAKEVKCIFIGITSL